MLSIAPGTYQESVAFPVPGTQEAPIILAAARPGTAILDGGGHGWCIGAPGSGQSGPPSWLVLQGLVLRNARTGILLPPGSTHITVQDCEVHSCRFGLSCAAGSDLLLRRTYLHDNAHSVVLGVKGTTGVERVRIEDCRAIYNRYPDREGNTDGFILENPYRDVALVGCEAAYSDDAGFDVKPPGTLISRCWAHHNRGEGFKVWGAGTYLVNCLAVDNYDTGITMASSSVGAALWNCTIAFNTRCGLRPGTNPLQRLTVRNCIIAFNPVRQYEEHSGPGVYDDDHNLYFALQGEPLWIIMDAETPEGRKRREVTLEELKGGALSLGPHTIFADPCFRDPATHDVHLLPKSPALGVGLTPPFLAEDFTGLPCSPMPSLGCYGCSRG